MSAPRGLVSRPRVRDSQSFHSSVMARAERANGEAPFTQEVVMPQLVKKSVEKRRARVLKTRPQVRKTFPSEAELRSLARSVMKRQLHPLIIMPDDTILDGECRW